MGETFTYFLAEGRRTAGAFSLVDEQAKRGETVPLHRHENDMESFYVLEGEVTFFVGDEPAVLAGKGAFIHVNRMARDRLNVRHYTIEPGEVVACTVSKADDFMSGRFVLPDGDFERIDMRILDGSFQEMMRVDDIVIDARYGHAVMFIPARPVQSEASAITHYVLVVPGDTGDREIGRSSMDHAALSE
jgi:quercetin dioxygenase-like cupin family protein